MKAFIIYAAFFALSCGGNVLANNENETNSIDERLDAIQFSMNEMFLEASEQMEALATEIRQLKQSLDHLAWYSEQVKESVASIHNSNELLLRNMTIITQQSDQITENQQYCANHEALKNLFFELKPKCGEFHPSPKPPEMIYRSCKYAPQKSGVYRLALNSSDEKTVQVYCEMEEFGGGWLVFQKRQDGSVNFNRSWVDYRNGFGSPSGEYWLGLEILNELTTRSQHELLILFETFNGTTFYERYSGIVVDGESQKYKVYFNSSGSGTAGDSLYAYRGEIFVTPDVQSGSYLDCAKQLGSGFWHYNCNPVDNRNNLNGVYGTTNRREGIWWHSINTGVLYNPLKRVQMLIREKN